MNNQTNTERPAATPPVAMQRGRRADRTLLARLRADRRWIVRDRDKAGLVPDPPVATRAANPLSTDVALADGRRAAAHRRSRHPARRGGTRG